MPVTPKKAPPKPPKSIEELRERMAKRFGTNIIRTQDQVGRQVTSTGSFALDIALQTGGWVEGRMHELVGPPDVGKSSLAINSMAASQHKYPGSAVGYINIEKTFDDDWAVANGLDLDGDRFFPVYPEGSEDVSDVIRDFCTSGLVKMVVVDSIGGMESKRALDKDAEEYDVGRNAQIITRMCKATAYLADRYGVTVIFVNQPRANIGSFTGGDTSAGPKAFKHSTTTKVQMSRTAVSPLYMGNGLDKVEIGVQVRARVSRSKVGTHGRAAEFWIMAADTEHGNVGVNRLDEAFQIGEFYKIITRSGGSYTVPGREKSIIGKAAVLQYLKENPKVAELIRDQALKASGEASLETEVSFQSDAEQDAS
jgi:recombination protein RecA